jgi:methyl-accepting chemotaxis protein
MAFPELMTNATPLDEVVDDLLSGRMNTTEEAFNIDCYNYNTSSEKLTWDEANQFCADQGGQLALEGMRNGLDNRMEIINEMNLPNTEEFWIGLRRENGMWNWINNQTADSEEAQWFMSWLDDSLFSDDCANMMVRRFSIFHHGLTMRDNCQEKMFALCEFKRETCEPTEEDNENAMMAIDAAANAVVENLQPVIDNITDIATEVIDDLQPAFDNITRLVENLPLADNITELANEVADNLQPALDNITEIATGIADDLQPVLDNITETANEIADNLPSFDNITNAVSNFDIDDFPSADNFTEIADEIAENLQPTLDNITAAANEIANNLPSFDNITDTVSNFDINDFPLADNITEITNEIAENLQPTLNNITEVATDFVGNLPLADNITQIATDLTDNLSPVVDNMTDFATELVDTFQNITTSLGTD